MGKINVFRIVCGIIVLVISFLVIDEGFYMDENGLLAIYKGIYQGQHMFTDAWGPLQMGGLITYPLFALYYEVLEPIISPMGVGFVLYMRWAYQIIRLLIAVYLYFTVKRSKYEDSAFAVSLLYYMLFMTYKNFSYKSMCDFAIILFICFMFRYIDTANKAYFVLMGVATCIAVVAYPTMIVLPVVFVATMLFMSYKGYELLKPTICYIITCVVIGAAVVVYLQLTTGFANILPQLQYLEDSDFDQPAYIRLGMMLASYAVFAVIAYFPVFVLWILSKNRYVAEETKVIVLSLYWILFMISICAIKFDSVSESRFVYGVLVIFFWFPYFHRKLEDNEYTRIGRFKQPRFDEEQKLTFVFFISIVAQLIWAVSTNQEITVPGHMAYYVLLAVIMLLEEQFKEVNLLKYGVLVFALFFMGFWVAESNGGYNDIVEPRYFAEEGAYKGIALDETDYQMNESVMAVLRDNVTADDYLLVAFGSNSTGYLNSDAHQGAGSAYTRTHINNRLLEYWEMNPNNQADYVLIDTASPKYEVFLESECGKYIMANYAKTVAKDGNIILLGK